MRCSRSFLRTLRALTPPRIPFGDIHIALGSPWVPPDVVEDFILHLMNTQMDICRVRHDSLTGSWDIKNKNRFRSRVRSSKTWGTGRKPALEILESSLNMRNATVTDEIDCPTSRGGKKTVVNHSETVAAMEKQRLMEQEFRSWVWKNASRRQRLEDIYNDRFCNVEHRRFDGGFLDLPGMSSEIRLRPYQKDAIARILLTPNTLLAHDVGAGKTYVCIAAGMELKRMGLSSNNLYVVPNNVLGQWRQSFHELYPDADVLVIEPDDFVPAKRQEVLADIRDGGHDAVLMAYSSFGLIPFTRAYEFGELERKIGELDSALADASRRTSGASKARAAVARKLDKMLEETANVPDRGICFDELGITRLFVDEAHNFKNLSIGSRMSRVSGVSSSSSEKCTHMLGAVRCVQRCNGGAGVVFATGTVLSNSLADCFVMQTYLQSGALGLMELQTFEAWCGMFAERRTDWEIDVDTSTYKLSTRLANFGNLEALTSTLSEIADFHHMDAEDGVPECDGREDVLIPKTEQFSLFLEEISLRADRVRKGRISAEEDNLLKICTDGRKAALDMRLVRPETECSPQSKIAYCADRVFEVYSAETENRGAQLVFSDIGTPKDEFNVYDELKGALVAKGIPSREIAYVHAAKTEKSRQKLFADVASGRIRILIGSTPKLGLGVNVQERLAAVHHLDIPWRPADMIQREGRILRAGNGYSHVRIFRYVTEGSFDAYSWQLLESKQRIIDSLLSGSYAGETLSSDIGDAALSYGEIKALAVNNPLLRERVEVFNELQRNLILRRKAVAAHAGLLEEREMMPDRIARLEERELAVVSDAYLGKANPRSRYSTEELGLRADALYRSVQANDYRGAERTRMNYRGFDVVLPAGMNPNEPYVYLQGIERYRVELKGMKLKGLLARLDHVIDRLDSEASDIRKRIEGLYEDWGAMEEEAEKSIEAFDEAIERCRDRLAMIDLRLEEEHE